MTSGDDTSHEEIEAIAFGTSAYPHNITSGDSRHPAGHCLRKILDYARVRLSEGRAVLRSSVALAACQVTTPRLFLLGRNPMIRVVLRTIAKYILSFAPPWVPWSVRDFHVY